MIFGAIVSDQVWVRTRRSRRSYRVKSCSVRSASSMISRTIAPAGSTLETKPTPWPAHIASASISPSASAPGVYD
jgi:hypothetical protein